MVNLERIEIENMMDCCKYNYRFNLNDCFINFYQAGNRDLYFACFCKEMKKEIELKININEDYQLYKALEKLYSELTHIDENSSYLRKYEVNSLFNGKYISWESDECCQRIIDPEERTYNYLNIYKKEDEFILKFINNSNHKNFNVSFNTDRSKYYSLVYPFMGFMQNLENVTEDNHQISIDEWLHTKKLIKK